MYAIRSYYVSSLITVLLVFTEKYLPNPIMTNCISILTIFLRTAGAVNLTGQIFPTRLQQEHTLLHGHMKKMKVTRMVLTVPG